MPFKKFDVNRLPPRQWAVAGYPGSGKSTFAAQMRAPILPIDADHRFAEVAGLVAGDVFQLSADPADNNDAERIAALLKAHMAGAGVQTVIVDSLTSIVTPLVVEAILDNDSGRNKNRVSAFKDKAMAMRLLQDAITGWGVDTLWIYHLRAGLDGHAVQRETASISSTELARLRRSLNYMLRVVADGQRRGICIDWARRGRSGLTLWDDSGSWRGMPELIEEALYDGLSQADMERIEKQSPTSFTGPAEAIAWGFEQGVFRDAVHAANAYEKLKADQAPATAPEMWQLWVAEVGRRRATT